MGLICVGGLVAIGLTLAAPKAAEAVTKAAEEVKRKPLITLALAFGLIATLAADVAKDSLPGADAVTKNLVKFGSGFLFLLAGWLYDSKIRRVRVAGVVIWLAFPLLLTVGFLMTPPDSTGGGGTGLMGWGFVGGWFLLVVLVFLLSWAVRRHETELNAEL